jgi:hypothetical protein
MVTTVLQTKMQPLSVIFNNVMDHTKQLGNGGKYINGIKMVELIFYVTMYMIVGICIAGFVIMLFGLLLWGLIEIVSRIMERLL